MVARRSTSCTRSPESSSLRERRSVEDRRFFQLRVVDHREVLKLIAADGQIVDVLPAHEYRVAAVRGALHLPLPKLLHHAERTLDKTRPVVVYCRDCL